MSWDLDTLRLVQAVRAAVLIYPENFLGRQRDVDAMAQGVAARLARELAGAIRQHASVTITDRDITITRNPDPATHGEFWTAHWWPETRDVEIIGGPDDGRTLTWEQHPEPLRVPRRSGPARGSILDVLARTPAEVDVYELAGWQPDARHWTYTLRRAA